MGNSFLSQLFQLRYACQWNQALIRVLAIFLCTIDVGYTARQSIFIINWKNIQIESHTIKRMNNSNIVYHSRVIMCVTDWENIEVLSIGLNKNVSHVMYEFSDDLLKRASGKWAEQNASNEILKQV